LGGLDEWAGDRKQKNQSQQERDLLHGNPNE